MIITGATGMVGRGVLLECLDHEAISRVLVIGRSSVEMEHPKLVELLHDDFEDFSAVKDQLAGYDACYFCLGISVAGLTEEQYTRITLHYTMALADVLFEANPSSTFIYVSGAGTDSTEKGRITWARVKGKTENSLLQKGFKQAFMFRPGIIIPLRGIRSKTRLYQFFYDYFLWLIKFIKIVAPGSVCNTTQVGLAMIKATLSGYEKPIFHPKDIIHLSGR